MQWLCGKRNAFYGNDNSSMLRNIFLFTSILLGQWSIPTSLFAQDINDEIQAKLSNVKTNNGDSEREFASWLESKNYSVDEKKKLSDKTLANLIEKISHPGAASEVLLNLNQGIRSKVDGVWKNNDSSEISPEKERLLNRLNLIAKTPYYQIHQWTISEETHLENFPKGDLASRVKEYVIALGSEGEHFYIPPGGKVRILIEVEMSNEDTKEKEKKEDQEFEIVVTRESSEKNATITIEPVSDTIADSTETVKSLKTKLANEYGIQIIDGKAAPDYFNEKTLPTFKDWNVEELAAFEKSLASIKSKTGENWLLIKNALQSLPVFRIDNFENPEKNGEYTEFKKESEHTIVRAISLSDRAFERQTETERNLIHEVSHAVINHNRFQRKFDVEAIIGKAQTLTNESINDYANMESDIKNAFNSEAEKVTAISNGSIKVRRHLNQGKKIINTLFIKLNSNKQLDATDLQAINNFILESNSVTESVRKEKTRVENNAHRQSDISRQKMMQNAASMLNELIDLTQLIGRSAKLVTDAIEERQEQDKEVHSAINAMLNSTRKHVTPVFLTNYAATNMRATQAKISDPSVTVSDKYNGAEEYWAEGFSLWVAESEFMQNPEFESLTQHYESTEYLEPRVAAASSSSSSDSPKKPYKNTGGAASASGDAAAAPAAASSKISDDSKSSQFQPGYAPRPAASTTTAKPTPAPEKSKGKAKAKSKKKH